MSLLTAMRTRHPIVFARETPIRFAKHVQAGRLHHGLDRILDSTQDKQIQ